MFFRGLLYALLPSIVLWATIGAVAHRSFLYLSLPPAPLLAAVEQLNRFN